MIIDKVVFSMLAPVTPIFTQMLPHRHVPIVSIRKYAPGHCYHDVRIYVYYYFEIRLILICIELIKKNKT